MSNLLAEINAARPDILWVGMGDPRQVLWASAWRQQLEVGLVLTCGGMFKIVSGELARLPPRWRQKGFEWVYRLWQEPATWRRYLLGLPLFGLRVLAQCLWGGERLPKSEGEAIGRLMKVSYFNYHYDIEGSAIGAATQVRAIAAALTRLGHQVDVQFRTAKPPGEDREYLGLKKIRGLRRYGHVPRLIWRNFALIREELKLLDQFRPDVVLAVSSYANFSALAASPPPPPAPGAVRRGAPGVRISPVLPPILPLPLAEPLAGRDQCAGGRPGDLHLRGVEGLPDALRGAGRQTPCRAQRRGSPDLYSPGARPGIYGACASKTGW